MPIALAVFTLLAALTPLCAAPWRAPAAGVAACRLAGVRGAVVRASLAAAAVSAALRL